MAKVWDGAVCAGIQEAVREKRKAEPGAAFVTAGAFGYETEDNHIASGRAACARCGARIAAGEKCLRAVDTNGELWRAAKRFLHAACPTSVCPGCGFAHVRGTECEAGAFDDDGVRSAPAPGYDPFSLLD